MLCFVLVGRFVFLATLMFLGKYIPKPCAFPCCLPSQDGLNLYRGKVLRGGPCPTAWITSEQWMEQIQVSQKAEKLSESLLFWEPRAGSRPRWRQRHPAPCQQGPSAPRTLWDAPEGRRPGPARPRAPVPVPAVAGPAPERATAAVAAAAQARWGGQHALLPAPRGRGRGRHFAGGGFSAPGGHRREGSAAGAARDSQRAGKGSARLPFPSPPRRSAWCQRLLLPRPSAPPPRTGAGSRPRAGPAQPRLPRPRPAGPLVTVPTRQGFAALPCLPRCRRASSVCRSWGSVPASAAPELASPLAGGRFRSGRR